MTDSELVARAREGDRDAFGALVDRHRAAVYRAALAALGRPTEAEDAAQEAFVAAYRKLAGFRGESSFKTWVVAIAWRQALDQRRSLRSRLRRFVAGSSDDFAEPEAPEATPESALLAAESVTRLRRALQALAPSLRDALLLAASGDHSYAEIGALLGIAEGTVKWRVSEARGKLREWLEREGYRHE